MPDYSQPLSPEKYLVSKCRDLPFYECLINTDWEEQGMASILISRKMPSGKIIVGFYIVDTYCLGLKNSLFKFAVTETEYQEFLAEISGRSMVMMECGLTQAHNIIYGAIDYAEELGFQPEKSFKITEFILDFSLIDDGIDRIKFGRDDKPFFVAGPYDNVSQIIAKLEKSVGAGNFDFVLPPEY